MGTESHKLELGISKIDKKMLKILLEPNGHLKTTKSISTKLGIPVTTIRGLLDEDVND